MNKTFNLSRFLLLWSTAVQESRKNNVILNRINTLIFHEENLNVELQYIQFPTCCLLNN